jgi:transposase
VSKVQVRALRRGNGGIMDNLASPKRAPVHDRIKSSGATLRFPPPYNADFNCIEKAFSPSRPPISK